VAAQATAAPHTPAAQLAQAAAGIHIAPGATGQLTIHLQPAEFGAVQVRIERAHDGSATVTVQVERAETLHAIQQDMPHFHAAMDAAGLPTAQRAVTLHLAPSSGSDAGGAGNFADSQRQPPRQGRPPPAEPIIASDEEPQWQAAGVNITA
jgi:flagellar hook-length control protein FliK